MPWATLLRWADTCVAVNTCTSSSPGSEAPESMLARISGSLSDLLPPPSRCRAKRTALFGDSPAGVLVPAT